MKYPSLSSCYSPRSYYYQMIFFFLSGRAQIIKHFGNQCAKCGLFKNPFLKRLIQSRNHNYCRKKVDRHLEVSFIFFIILLFKDICFI